MVSPSEHVAAQRGAPDEHRVADGCREESPEGWAGEYLVLTNSVGSVVPRQYDVLVKFTSIPRMPRFRSRNFFQVSRYIAMFFGCGGGRGHLSHISGPRPLYNTAQIPHQRPSPARQQRGRRVSPAIAT